MKILRSFVVLLLFSIQAFAQYHPYNPRIDAAAAQWNKAFPNSPASDSLRSSYQRFFDAEYALLESSGNVENEALISGKYDSLKVIKELNKMKSDSDELLGASNAHREQVTIALKTTGLNDYDQNKIANDDSYAQIKVWANTAVYAAECGIDLYAQGIPAPNQKKQKFIDAWNSYVEEQEKAKTLTSLARRNTNEITTSQAPSLIPQESASQSADLNAQSPSKPPFDPTKPYEIVTSVPIATPLPSSPANGGWDESKLSIICMIVLMISVALLPFVLVRKWTCSVAKNKTSIFYNDDPDRYFWMIIRKMSCRLSMVFIGIPFVLAVVSSDPKLSGGGITIFLIMMIQVFLVSKTIVKKRGLESGWNQLYLFILNEVKGPFPAYQIRKMIATGGASWETLCCTQGNQMWVPLRSLNR